MYTTPLFWLHCLCPINAMDSAWLVVDLQRAQVPGSSMRRSGILHPGAVGRRLVVEGCIEVFQARLKDDDEGKPVSPGECTRRSP